MVELNENESVLVPGLLPVPVLDPSEVILYYLSQSSPPLCVISSSSALSLSLYIYIIIQVVS